MPVKLDMIPQKMSYQPDWSTTWKQQACECAPATYGGAQRFSFINSFISVFQMHFFQEIPVFCTNIWNYLKS